MTNFDYSISYLFIALQVYLKNKQNYCHIQNGNSINCLCTKCTHQKTLERKKLNNNMNKDFMYGTASEYVCKYTWRSAL